MGRGRGRRLRIFGIRWRPVRGRGRSRGRIRARLIRRQRAHHLEHDGLVVDTEIFCRTAGEIATVTTVRIKNVGKVARQAGGDAGDEAVFGFIGDEGDGMCRRGIQTAAFTRVEKVDGFWLEMRDHNGIPANRMRAAIVSDLRPTTFEVLEERFLGAGRWDSPQAAWDGKLALSASGKLPAYGEATAERCGDCAVERDGDGAGCGDRGGGEF